MKSLLLALGLGILILNPNLATAGLELGPFQETFRDSAGYAWDVDDAGNAGLGAGVCGGVTVAQLTTDNGTLLKLGHPCAYAGVPIEGETETKAYGLFGLGISALDMFDIGYGYNISNHEWVPYFGFTISGALNWGSSTFTSDPFD